MQEINHKLNRAYMGLYQRLEDERGQTTAEYVGLIALVAGALAVTAGATGADGGLAAAVTGKVKEAIENIGK